MSTVERSVHCGVRDCPRRLQARSRIIGTVRERQEREQCPQWNVASIVVSETVRVVYRHAHDSYVLCGKGRSVSSVHSGTYRLLWCPRLSASSAGTLTTHKYYSGKAGA